ncbi:MAG: outer membrane lipoprotein chaperone LolA [Proteobacteria bacterium]|nr:outer membrane lipoprotein chaperone LolA [Pseudomonadota bacterium]
MNKKILITVILMLTSFLTFAQATPESEANKLLDNVRKDLVSLHADFSQYEIDINGKFTEKQYGKVWLSSPNKFKWQYLKPIPQLIIASGTQLWIYDADLEQVTIRKQDNKQNPIYVLLNKQATEKNYKVSLVAQDQESKDKTQWIKMLPNKPSDEVKVVWLGIENNNLTSLKLQNQMDNTVVFEFKNITKNPKLEESFFTFDIPKGTDIIRNSAPVGEF